MAHAGHVSGELRREVVGGRTEREGETVEKEGVGHDEAILEGVGHSLPGEGLLITRIRVGRKTSNHDGLLMLV